MFLFAWTALLNHASLEMASSTHGKSFKHGTEALPRNVGKKRVQQCSSPISSAILLSIAQAPGLVLLAVMFFNLLLMLKVTLRMMGMHGTTLPETLSANSLQGWYLNLCIAGIARPTFLDHEQALFAQDAARSFARHIETRGPAFVQERSSVASFRANVVVKSRGGWNLAMLKLAGWWRRIQPSSFHAHPAQTDCLHCCVSVVDQHTVEKRPSVALLWIKLVGQSAGALQPGQKHRC